MATPSNHRLSVGPWGLKLTPLQHSPSIASRPIPRASSKRAREDTDLSLSHVIGTTANSPNAVATLSSSRLLAFTAGAAAVICTFDENLKFAQRFYRARPTAVPLNPSTAVYGPSTPTHASTYRNRGAAVESITISTPFSPTAADHADSPGSRSWATRERVKAATCVSLSSDGKYLAVGETGYKPRVLIFSTSKESSSDCPLTCLSDHTVGVHSVAFSPNSQYLASLGTDRDGFLFIWSINSRNGAATLLASNKCTNQISQIAWMGSSLISVGKRHVKVWRLDESNASTPVTTPIKAIAGFFSRDSLSQSAPSPTKTHRTLHGRNCLLGPLQDCRFTSVVCVSSNAAIVCADSGDICYIDDIDGCQRFRRLTKVDFAITAASLCPNGDFLVAGAGVYRCFQLSSLLVMSYDDMTDDSMRESQQDLSGAFIVSLNRLGNHLVTVDEERAISLIDTPDVGICCSPQPTLRLPAHGGAVLGVRQLAKKDLTGAAFYSWSADGTILFWSADGQCVHTYQIDLDQSGCCDAADPNELRVVRCLASAGLLIAGDKLGFLSFIDQKSGRCMSTLRAHNGEVTDIACLQSRDLVVSCSRDRTTQVFQPIRKSGQWELQQTLDEHVGAVTGLLFTNDGKTLLSCSSDRTVVVREALERTEDGQIYTIFEMKRCIQTKATPVSMALLTDRDDALFVSTMERVVQKWNLVTGQMASSFKCGDADGGDAVILSSLTHLASFNGTNILAGVSSTDKSLRLYNENGSIVARDWGHTEGITDLTIILPSKNNLSPDKADDGHKSLVTVAADGTVFIWSYAARPVVKHDLSSSMELMGISPPKDLLAAKPPLRRVLSQSEMARFRQASPEQEEVATPTHGSKRIQQQQPLIRKSSRFSLAQIPKLDPVPSAYESAPRRRTRINRSPSPPSPNRKSPHHLPMRRKSYMDLTTRSSANARATRGTNVSSSTGTSQDLANGTDVICRALRSYRRKLSATNDNLAPDKLREIERELTATVRAVGEKAIKARDAFEEGMMEKFLSQYSEKLLEILQERMSGAKASEHASSASGGASSAEEETAVETPTGLEDDRPEKTVAPVDREERSRKAVGSLAPVAMKGVAVRQ